MLMERMTPFNDTLESFKILIDDRILHLWGYSRYSHWLVSIAGFVQIVAHFTKLRHFTLPQIALLDTQVDNTYPNKAATQIYHMSPEDFENFIVRYVDPSRVFSIDGLLPAALESMIVHDADIGMMEFLQSNVNTGYSLGKLKSVELHAYSQTKYVGIWSMLPMVRDALSVVEVRLTVSLDEKRGREYWQTQNDWPVWLNLENT